MFKMDLILENSMAQIHLNSYLLRGKWSTVAVPYRVILNLQHWCAHSGQGRPGDARSFDTVAILDDKSYDVFF